MGGPPGSRRGARHGGAYTGPLGGQELVALVLGWRPGEGRQSRCLVSGADFTAALKAALLDE